MRLPHTVEVWRATPTGTPDDYNQTPLIYASIATVQAFIQDKTGVELAQLNEAGPVRGRYTIFLRSTDVTEGDQILHLATSEVFEPTFVENASGLGQHLEIDAERVWP